MKMRSFSDFEHFLSEISVAESLERLSTVISQMRISHDLAHIVYHAIYIPSGGPAHRRR